MTISQYSSLIAGFSGGTASTLVCHPLDLLKIRYAVNDTTNIRPQYKSYFHAAKCIIKAEGVRGLYQGLSPNLAAAPLSWGLYFHFYHKMRPHLEFIPEKFELRNLITGCLAGATVAAITNPLWVAKTRLCLQYEGKTKKYRGLIHCLKRITVEEGLKGLYKGFGPALFGTLHGGIQFAAYNFFKDRKCRIEEIPQGSQLSMFDYFVFSAISKVIATTSTYPYQVVRARLQDQHTSYSSSRDVVFRTVKREGISGLYKGMFLATLRQLPGGIVTYVVYEKVKRLIEDLDRN